MSACQLSHRHSIAKLVADEDSRELGKGFVPRPRVVSQPVISQPGIWGPRQVQQGASPAPEEGTRSVSRKASAGESGRRRAREEADRGSRGPATVAGTAVTGSFAVH